MSAEEKKAWIRPTKQTILRLKANKAANTEEAQHTYFSKKNVFLTTMFTVMHQTQPRSMDSMVLQFFKVISFKELKAELLLTMVLVTELFVITNTSYSELKGCRIE